MEIIDSIIILAFALLSLLALLIAIYLIGTAIRLLFTGKFIWKEFTNNIIIGAFITIIVSIIVIGLIPLIKGIISGLTTLFNNF